VRHNSTHSNVHGRLAGNVQRNFAERLDVLHRGGLVRAEGVGTRVCVGGSVMCPRCHSS
jgi:hypothetical protein